MKNTISKISLVFAIGILFFSCSKNNEDPEPTLYEYEFNTETIIPDNEVMLISINVKDDAIIIDPTKVYIEIRLQHAVARDLSFGYLMPDDDGEAQSIVNNLGGINAYSSANTLTFNSTAIETINPSVDNIYPNFVVPAGRYREGTSDAQFPVETPLFNGMMGKNIRGDWQFFFLDTVELNEGSLISVKLIFEEGSLSAN